MKLDKLIFFALTILLFMPVKAQEAGPLIMGIDVKEGPHSVTIKVNSDKKTFFHVVRAPNLIQVDIPNGKFAGVGKRVPVYINKVKLYSTESLEGGELLRLKVVLFEAVPYEVIQDEKSLSIVVNNQLGDLRAFEEKLRVERLEAERSEQNRAKAIEYFKMGSSLLKEKKYNDAIKNFEQALTYSPGDPDISTALEVAREAKMVIEHFNREFQLAEDAFTAGNWAKAISEFTDFLDKYPDNDNGLYYLGRALYEIGEYGQAALRMRRLININPYYPNIDLAHDILRRAERSQSEKVSGNITVKAESESLTDVLQEILRGTGLRLNILGNISRIVSVDIKNANLKMALDEVVNKNGATWTQKGDIIEITPAENIREFVQKMHFQDLPLGEILDILSGMMQVNLIINEEVDIKKNVTFYVKNHNITLDELFDLLLKTNNLVKREYNKTTFFIVDKDKAKMFDYEKRYQKIYNLNNVEPEEILGVLTSVESYKEKINFSNIVVINLDDESNIISTESRRIFTTKYPEDLIETITKSVGELAELKDADGKQLTVIETPDDLLRLLEREMTLPTRKRLLLPTWGDQSTITEDNMKELKNGGVTELLENYNAELAKLLKRQRKVKAMLVYDTDAAHEIIESVINRIDQKRKQVLVSMKIMEINKQVRDQLGLTWRFDGNSSTLDVRKLGDISSVDINTTFNFLASKNLAKEVSSPTIRVLDGHTASTEVTTTKWVTTLERVTTQASAIGGDAGGSSTISTGEEYRAVPQQQDFGLKLSVTPTVHQDKEVTLDVNVSQTVDAGEVNMQYQSGDKMIAVPFTMVKTRLTNTTVRMRDSETVIMGGLIQNIKQDRHDEVPLVNRLPLLGRLFRNKNVDDTTSEMIIVISPYIVNEGSEAKVMTNELKAQDDIDYATTIAKLKAKLSQ